MSERTNELQGNVKKTYGKLRHNPQPESAGAVEAAAARVERKLEGATDEAVGSVQEYLGASAADPLLTAKGKARRVRGSIRRKG